MCTALAVGRPFPYSLLLRLVLLTASVLVPVCAASADPVRIVVPSRYSEALATAAEAFEARYGEGLIQLQLGESTIGPDALRSADVVFAHYMSAQVFARVAPGVKLAVARGATALAVPGDNLVVGFGAVVCGLVLSGVASYFTLVRERCARIDIKDMEDLCELLMRAVKRADAREVAHASIRSA